MADHASFDFRFVLVNKRPLFFGVAFVADLVARRIRPQLFWPERPVRAVAIVALDQPFVHPVVERSRKLCAHIHVAAVAQFRRLRFHQKLAFLCVMRRVAINATYAVRQMHGAVVVTVLFGVLVAPQAARTGLLWRRVLERENLALVPSTVHMFFARSMTRLTPMPSRPLVGF